ncbi:iron chaperone [Aminipila sp.]|uniref:iron chaperone n=1 Tax=Aminipila sp. TaxID=2060095 RepID=UPI0028A260EA|nr:DUF1801 domain-containing protein [Aminipila sp.]
MIKNNSEVDNYISALPEVERDWMIYFINYMRENHSELEEVISFKMPTYKLGSGKLRNYIAFSPAKNHFSMHSMDFEYIAMLKEELSNPGKGKGCVNVNYSKKDERKILIKGIEDIIKRKKLATYGN